MGKSIMEGQLWPVTEGMVAKDPLKSRVFYLDMIFWA